MFIFYLAVIMFVFGGLCWLRYKNLKGKNINNEWNFGGSVLIGLGIIMLMISVLITMFSYSFQISNVEELKKLNKYEQIYLSKSEILTKKFEKYLLEIYPQHEKDIYNKIKPQDIDIYLVKYPELMASETIKLLVNQVRTLQNDYYAQSLLKADVVKRMIYNTKNPWIYYFLIPEYNK